MGRLNVEELRVGERLHKAPFLLAAVDGATDRNGEKYLRLTLRDRTGDIEARYWRVPAGVADQLSAGGGVAVDGQVTEYRGSLQVNVAHAFPCELEELGDYLPVARRSGQEMAAQLAQLRSEIQNAHLRGLLAEILDHPDFGGQFCLAPAAKTYHHACVGGLLEHSLDVAEQVSLTARRYPEKLDHDLAVTVALLHDVGKVDSYDLQGLFELTDVGKLLGHIYLGAARVERAIERIEGFPGELHLRVLHAILSHHGDLAKGSPVIPRTPEAVALHHADSLDGSLRGWVDHVDREASVDATWTPWSNMHGGELYVGGSDQG
jgi:3'-5' exoribonuclease